MRDDYLWDGSGEPDPDVQRLERLLGQFRHSDRPLELPEGVAPEKAARVLPWRARQWMPLLATAATVAIVIGGLWAALRVSAPGWDVARVSGAPMMNAARVTGSARLVPGGWLETDASSSARIAVGTIGEVEVEPNTRLRMLRARPRDQRLELARGTIHARIWAPPRIFSVETPSAVAIDLGCIYSLTVDSAGDTVVRVQAGWVGFTDKGRESFVPEGAMCVTRRGRGPGTPHYEDAPPELRDALARLDFDREEPEARGATLHTVLSGARGRDAFTLWHLLTRLRRDERARVFDSLAALAPPPAGVTRDGVLRGDRRMLEQWWDSLGLESTSWWRLWMGPVPRR